MELTDLMHLLIKPSDTQEIINRAKEIAAEHIYHFGGNALKSDVRYATKNEAIDLLGNINVGYFLVEDGQNVYNINRFKLALRKAREEFGITK